MFQKLMVRLTILVVLSLAAMPIGAAQAQIPAQETLPDCPPVNYASYLAHGDSLLKSLPPGCDKVYRAATPETGDEEFPEGQEIVAAVGGPDNFGYEWDDSVALNWIDTTAGTNTGLTGFDAVTGPISLPFSFKFYENTYKKIYIAGPGYLSFTNNGYWDDQQNIPSLYEPNNVIAPFWTPVYIGSGAWVHYKSGGSAPNRYFVVEWHDLRGGPAGDDVGADDKYRFEAILYENGDIVFQYLAMSITGSWWCGEAGLEDSAGEDGLSYVNFCNQPPSNKAVRFYRPHVSVKVNPLQQGSFTQAGATKAFGIDIRNSGDSGTDTYDLTASSFWPLTLYAANGTTLLTDTDSDGKIDTGPIAQGGVKKVIAKCSVPPDVITGDGNAASVAVTSSLDVSRSNTVNLTLSIPTSFVNVFEDDDNGAMSFMPVSNSGASIYKATSDSYYGYDVTVTKLVNGNYLYAWSKGRYNGRNWVTDIEYAILDSKGKLVRPVTNLTKNSGASMYVYSYGQSIAVAPNGTVGIAWAQELYNPATGKFNDNIYFATLNGAGTKLTGPTSITNNSIWGSYYDNNIPQFYYAGIAASDDNRFVLSWQKYLSSSTSYSRNIWYAVRSTAGGNVIAPAAVTSNDRSYSPILNSLSGGNVMLTWYSNAAPNYGTPTYAVLKSTGGFAKGATTFGVSNEYEAPDAVLLGNNKVALAWATETGVQLAILDPSYALESGPTYAGSPANHAGYNLSITSDWADRVVMTWMDAFTEKNLFYALGNSFGAFVTNPSIYKTSTSYLASSYNGQGIAPYRPNYVISGSTGVANASLNYPGGSVNSDLRGLYSINVLANWSGTVTPTHSCYTFEPVSQSYSNLESNQAGQNYDPTFDADSGCADINVLVGGILQSRTGLLPGQGERQSFSGENNGPLDIASANGLPLVASQRVIYGKVSYSEMMGLPIGQLSKEYLFPYYNNVAMNSQLRISNLGAGETTINVYLGSDPNPIDTFVLAGGGAERRNYLNQNSGPLRVASTDTNILATIRVLYAGDSYSELMGMPKEQLSKEYWYPVYDNVTTNSQLRVSNVGTGATNIKVYLAGNPAPIDTYTLQAGEASRKTYAYNSGPLQVVSDQEPILSTIRLLYQNVSYAEITGLPVEQLNKESWYPAYDNVEVTSELRVANAGAGTTTITVSAAGELIDSFDLAPGSEIRKTYDENTGPLSVVSSTEPILSSVRMLYTTASFSSLYEMMGLPGGQLSSQYFFPWYNNTAMKSQVRFAVP